MTKLNMDELKKKASEIRGTIVELSHMAGTPHLGSSLSCVDILVAAYWGVLNIDPAAPADENRDRFILSKGHAASALYATLAKKKFFTHEDLMTFAKPGSHFPEQPSPHGAPGVELATGSLGHGLPVGAGIALAGRIRRKQFRVICVLSDGECNEGSVWEAAMFAAAQKLGNLTVVVDYNKWQATGRSDEVMALPSLLGKWKAFGWNGVEVDGHDLDQLIKSLSHDWSMTGAPTAIVAHTVKGKGVSFMEDDNNWHYRSPNEDEVKKAKKELGLL